MRLDQVQDVLRQLVVRDRRMARIRAMLESLVVEIAALIDGEGAAPTKTRRAKKQQRRARLTPREKVEIGRRLAKGESYRSIGELFNLARSSVGNYGSGQQQTRKAKKARRR